MDGPEKDVEWAGARVAIAEAAVKALDDVLRTVRLHRKAAEAKYCQRLAEHTQAILAGKNRAAAPSTDDAGATGEQG